MTISSEAEIIELINAGEERLDLDYKDSINLEGGKKEKAEIAKDVIAMANSAGGIIIGGVKETSSGFVTTGMSKDELLAFDSTKLNQFVNSYCDPPINSTTRKIEFDGKIFGIIIVPEFGEQPHIVTRNCADVLFEGDLLVRTSNNESRRAGPHELRNLLNKAVTRRQGGLQKLLHSAVQSVKPQILDQIQPTDIEIPFETEKYLEKYKGFRILRVQPVDSRPSIDLLSMRSHVNKSSLYDQRTSHVSFPSADYRDSTETRLPIGIVYQYEIEQYQSLGFSYFDVDGNIFVTESLWEDSPGVRHPEGSLGVISCLKMIIEGLLFAVQYYRDVGWDGQFQIQFSVESSSPRQLVSDSNKFWHLLRRHQNSMATPVSVTRIISTGIHLNEIENIAIEMIREFCWYFYYDLGEDGARNYLDHLKENNLVIPTSLT